MTVIFVSKVLPLLLCLLLLAVVGAISEPQKTLKNANYQASTASTAAQSTTIERNKVSTPRFSRADDRVTDHIGDSIHEERDVGAAQVFGTVAKAMRAKAKLTIMVCRGFAPMKAVKKLKVASLNDKNFNSFARYYARYRVKYPQKAKALPATADILMPKLSEWFGQKLLQVQVKQKLKDIGVIDTEEYMNMYMKDADDAIVLPLLKEWLNNRVFPQQISKKLGEIGLTDTKYAQLYVTMWGEKQTRLFANANK